MRREEFLARLGESQVLEAILDTTQALILICDDAGSIMFVNKAMEETTGFSAKEYVGRPIWTFHALDDVAKAKRFFFEMGDDAEQFQRTTHWRRKDGKPLIFNWSVKRLFDDQGVEIGRIGTALNLTEQARAAARAIAAEGKRQMLTHLTDNLTEPLFFIDPDGTIAYASRAAKKVYGHAPDDLIGQPSSILRPMDKVEKMAAYMKRLHESGKAEMMETEAIHAEGYRIPVELRTAPVYDGDRYLGLAAVVYDMRERKDLEEELRRMAGTDPLTGVANRLGYETAAKHEVKRAERYKHPLALLIADIDFFKKVNDTYGHMSGDEVLKAFAASVCDTLRRPIDHIARLGGEEFVALLPETGLRGAAAAAERIREAVEAMVVNHAGHDIQVTVSIGVSHWTPGEEELAATLERADRALYRAKDGGRNQVVVELPEFDEEVSLAG